MLFLTSERGVDGVFEVPVYRDNFQGCQYDVHFIQCQILSVFTKEGGFYIIAGTISIMYTYPFILKLVI